MENKHAFTLSIDWEDFGQLHGRYHSGVVTPALPVTIDRQTNIILDMLEESGKKATFFILGMLADNRPDLVKKIAKQDHEIALHGYHHINLRNLDRDQVFQDLLDSKKLVTDIIGGPVYGYRAPYFSVDETNLYVLELLAEMGMTYDSSIFPIKLKRYGIAGFNKKDALYNLPNGKQIVELPLTVAPFFGKDIPIAGGGYIRMFSRFFLNNKFRKMDQQGENVMLYMHPYEFDDRPIDCSTNYPADQKQLKTKTDLINLRWNLNRGTIRGKLKSLLHTYNFITCLKKAENVKNSSYSPGVLGRT